MFELESMAATRLLSELRRGTLHCVMQICPKAYSVVLVQAAACKISVKLLKWSLRTTRTSIFVTGRTIVPLHS